MLIPQTYIASSSIHGIGLFAGEHITAGSVVWQFVPEIDTRLPVGYLKLIPRHKKIELINHSDITGDHKFLVIFGDNARFINHSKDPHLIFDDITAWALRDIKTGEEITDNYGERGLRK